MPANFGQFSHNCSWIDKGKNSNADKDNARDEEQSPGGEILWQ